MFNSHHGAFLPALKIPKTSIMSIMSEKLLHLISKKHRLQLLAFVETPMETPYKSLSERRRPLPLGLTETRIPTPVPYKRHLKISLYTLRREIERRVLMVASLH